jgi:hypothetical protein
MTSTNPCPLWEDALHNNNKFVDDKSVLALCSNIRGTLHNSAVSVFHLFGWPHEAWHSSCLAPNKCNCNASYDMLYLGFYICSRKLCMTWPIYKRAKLLNKRMTALGMKCSWFKPKVVASIIGKVVTSPAFSQNTFKETTTSKLTL